MKRLMVLGMLLVMGSATLAQAAGDLKVSAQVRHRYELTDTSFREDVGAYTFSGLRTRLGAEFSPSEDITGFVQVQDSRNFGEEFDTLADGEADYFDLKQAHIKVRNLFETPLTLILGRMEVAYANERLIGAVDWHEFGRSLDGGVLHWSHDKGWVDGFNFMVHEAMNPDDSGDTNVRGLWSEFTTVENYSIQPFWIWVHQDQFDSESTGLRGSPYSIEYDTHTLGAYVKGSSGDLRHETEFAFQTGKDKFGPDSEDEIDIGGYMAAVNVGYTMSDSEMKPDFIVGVDYLSGDDPDTDDKWEDFHTLLATNHKFYGYMDQFLNLENDPDDGVPGTSGLGLMDMHVKASIKPGQSKKTRVGAAFHIFKTAQEVELTDGKESALGSELDLEVKHHYTKNLAFQGGLSLFFPGELFNQVFGVGDDDAERAMSAYLMTTFNVK